MRHRAFVQVPELNLDVMIDGQTLMNRALDGDTVFIQLDPVQKWKVEKVNTTTSTTKYQNKKAIEERVVDQNKNNDDKESDWESVDSKSSSSSWEDVKSQESSSDDDSIGSEVDEENPNGNKLRVYSTAPPKKVVIKIPKKVEDKNIKLKEPKGDLKTKIAQINEICKTHRP